MLNSVFLISLKIFLIHNHSSNIREKIQFYCEFFIFFNKIL